mgnify:CR=1 FL=1
MGKRRKSKPVIHVYKPPVFRISTYRNPVTGHIVKIVIRRTKRKKGDKTVTVTIGLVYDNGELVYRYEREGKIWSKPDVYNAFLDYLHEIGRW